MAKSYDHKAIEKTWQERWEKDKLYETLDSVPGKENFYALFEFPYPSGDLHTGHWYAYTVPDMLVRMKRMQGMNLIFPIGFDAFGLPSENAAIRNKADPRAWTYENITKMRAQIKTMGNALDWSREVTTADPSFMKWTQWIFLKLFEKGLAYKKQALVNWDPVDMTVLANEQVLPDGTAERSGAVVEKRELAQWFFKITDYADRLIDDLAPLVWPPSIKEAQKNWIGRSDGAEIAFPIVDSRIKKFLILHGRGSTPDTAFIPWLKKSLEERGYSVQVPQLPHAEEPDDTEQADYVEKNCVLDEETAIVGHSFGGVVALRLLERGLKVARVTLVGTPYSGRFVDGEPRPSVTSAVMRGFNFEIIKKNVGLITLLYDTTDRAVPLADGDSYKAHLGGHLLNVAGIKRHFMNSQEPDVLHAALQSIRVFTTRPDTLFGATYLVLAPEHPFLNQFAVSSEQSAVKNWIEVDKYITASRKKSELDRQKQDKEKTGVRLGGISALNPATENEIPVYVADYVLSGYGTGAVMAVPAHDERDFEFAQAFHLPLAPVIAGGDISKGAYTEEGTLINSGAFTGKTSAEAKKTITEFVNGRATKSYKLRDWLVSRQRYWGAPIPIVYDKEGVAHPVPSEHLPWLLPTDVDHTPTGVSPLARSEELRERTEKIFGKGWTPDTDTLDTFVDSSWYFLRYLDSRNDREFASIEKQKAWMPIKRYSGGSEHTTVHVLYSRFLYKALFDMKLVTTDEPYISRTNRGIILAEDGRKMSKRWGNVVNPDELVANVGADSVRTYLGFIGPYNVVGSFPWSTNGLIGMRKFLERVYGHVDKISDIAVPPDMELLMNQTIKKVEDDLDAMKVNTSISQLMIFSNALGGLEKIPTSCYETLILLLAPFAPHLTEEIWKDLGHSSSVHRESWPKFDPTKLVSTMVTIAIMINGKTKGTIQIARGSNQNDVDALVRDDRKLNELATKTTSGIVFVQDKVINYIG